MALKCELCGNTEFVKEDGMFVCKGCNTKYSLEEAKKMMGEVDGDVGVKNSAQLENLLTLARSSFDSKNYAQAEEFCNQIIAIDNQNYEAWKMKGVSINYQINANNQRILEVFNCIMTSYRVLDDNQKKEKKYEILSSLKDCFEGEVDFWLKQFEASRPTDAALTKAKNAYVDAYNKMKAAFEELELEEAKEGYLINFDNFFIGKCNAICNSAWKTTVGYNYYRDYMGKGKDPFGRADQRWVISNTDLYRPMKNTWDTFVSETDNLIELLMFAEEQFNDETDPKVMEAIYSNIAYFEECVVLSGSWKITQGYTSNWDQYQTVGWHEEYSLNDTAKAIRRKRISEYNQKEKKAPREAEARQRAKAEKEKQERIAKYWEEHPEEKKKLDDEKAEINNKINEVNTQIDAIEKKNAPKLKELKKERDKKLPIDIEVEDQQDIIRALENQRANCGIFKFKEKKAITERIETVENPKLEELRQKAKKEKKEHTDKIDQQVALVNDDGKELREQLAKLKKHSDEITAELTKDR